MKKLMKKILTNKPANISKFLKRRIRINKLISTNFH